MRTKIEKFLERFPKDATSWSEATEEIIDLARESGLHLEEYDEIIVESLDVHSLKNPAEWNTKGRDYIIANFDRMKEETKKIFYRRFREWFEPEPHREEEIQKPWAMQMADGHLQYFDTHDQMVAFSVRPEVTYRKMGASKYIV